MQIPQAISFQRVPKRRAPRLHLPAILNHPICRTLVGRGACSSGVISRPIQIEEKLMKNASLIAGYLLALIFLVFGMNHYLNFIPMGHIPPGVAGQFFGVLMVSHYLYVVAFFEVVPAILLLVNRYVPLALVVLAPVIVNILLTGLLISALALPMAVVLTILWLLAAWRVRSVFLPLLQERVVPGENIAHPAPRAARAS
jgi:putative oxidoreductase